MTNGFNRSMRIAAAAIVFTAATGFAQGMQQPAPGNRPALEQEFRARVAKLAQQRLGLTDAQMTQLQQSNARFGPRHAQLGTQERETRRQLRVEMTSSTPNQQHVNQLLDATLSLQKQRIALIEEEQRDQARFMTPVQRAHYIALQQQFRKRSQELSGRGQRGFGGGGNRPR